MSFQNITYRAIAENCPLFNQASFNKRNKTTPEAANVISFLVFSSSVFNSSLGPNWINSLDGVLHDDVANLLLFSETSSSSNSTLRFTPKLHLTFTHKDTHNLKTLEKLRGGGQQQQIDYLSKSLRELTLNNPDPASLLATSGFEMLSTLVLSDISRLGEKSFSIISTFKNLKKLHVFSTMIMNLPNDFCQSLESAITNSKIALEELIVSPLRLTPSNVKEQEKQFRDLVLLPLAPSLRKLTLSGLKWEEDDQKTMIVDGISKLTNLEYLSLDRMSGLFSFATQAIADNLPKLRRLSISPGGVYLRDDDIAPLGKLRHLEMIPGTDFALGYGFLQNKIQVDSEDNCDDSINAAAFPSLTELNIRSGMADDVLIGTFENQKKLKKLRFGWNMKGSWPILSSILENCLDLEFLDMHVAARDADAFYNFCRDQASKQRLMKLHTLALHGNCSLTPASFTSIGPAFSKSLKKLLLGRQASTGAQQMAQNRIAFAQSAFAIPSQTVQSLIDDEVISYVAELVNLEHLDISYRENVTGDVGLERHIGPNLKNLNTLFFEGCSFTFENVKRFLNNAECGPKKMNNLRRIDVGYVPTFSKLTQEELDEIKKEFLTPHSISIVVGGPGEVLSLL